MASVRHVDELPAALASAARIHLLCGVNSDSGAASAPAAFPGLEALPCDASAALHTALCACRSIKTAPEIELLRYVAKLSSDAHLAVMRTTKPGLYEYQLEATFLHHCYMWGGARHVGYTCICAGGPNAAVLHYGHAGAPNDRPLADGDIALLDMGAEYACYGADITRSFPVSGRFSADQALVYNAVLAAQDAVFAGVRPGVDWADMHRAAEAALLAALTACVGADAHALAPTRRLMRARACSICQRRAAARHARGAGGGAAGRRVHAARPRPPFGAHSSLSLLLTCASFCFAFACDPRLIRAFPPRAWTRTTWAATRPARRA